MGAATKGWLPIMLGRLASPRVSRLARGLVAAGVLMLGCESSSPAKAPTIDPDQPQAEPSAHEPLPEGLDHQVASFLEQYGRNWPTFRFHGVVMVARGDQVAVHRAFGSADLVDGVPNETHTVFRVGTLSAQLTAAAIMRLHEAGALDLDDLVTKHLPDWPAGSSITIEHLLAHQSGIPNFTDDLTFEIWKKGARSLGATLGRFRGDPLEFEPGTDTNPSNSNYVLLGAILEAVAQEPYEQVVREQVLEPLSLTHTHYARTDEPQAVGMVFNEGEYLEVVDGVEPSAFGPAGGWLSTAGDMMRLAQGLSHDELLSRHGTMRMQGLTEDGLGYGWAPSDAAGHAGLAWPGLIDGFNSAVLYVPEDDTTIVVLSNSEVIPAGELVEGIAALAYGQELSPRQEPRAMPMPIEPQLHAVGRYVPTVGTEQALAASGADAEAIHEVYVRREDDHLVFAVPHHAAKRMHPLGGDRYFFKDGVQTRAQVIVRADQSPLLILEAQGGEVRFVRASEGASAPG